MNWICVQISLIHCAFATSCYVLIFCRYQKSTNTYAPYNKDWIKEKIYILLRRQAAKANWTSLSLPSNPLLLDFSQTILFYFIRSTVGRSSHFEDDNISCIQFFCYISPLSYVLLSPHLCLVLMRNKHSNSIFLNFYFRECDKNEHSSNKESIKVY